MCETTQASHLSYPGKAATACSDITTEEHIEIVGNCTATQGNEND